MALLPHPRTLSQERRDLFVHQLKPPTVLLIVMALLLLGGAGVLHQLKADAEGGMATTAGVLGWVCAVLSSALALGAAFMGAVMLWYGRYRGREN